MPARFWNQTVTPLGISGSFVGTVREVPGGSTDFAYYVATVVADQAGTLRVDFRVGATFYRAIADVAVAANVPQTVRIPMVAEAFRPTYTNGATGQASFALNDGVMTA